MHRFSPLLIGVSPPSNQVEYEKAKTCLRFSPLLIGVSPPSRRKAMRNATVVSFSPLLIGVSPPSC